MLHISAGLHFKEQVLFKCSIPIKSLEYTSPRTRVDTEWWASGFAKMSGRVSRSSVAPPTIYEATAPYQQRINHMKSPSESLDWSMGLFKIVWGPRGPNFFAWKYKRARVTWYEVPWWVLYSSIQPTSDEDILASSEWEVQCPYTMPATLFDLVPSHIGNDSYSCYFLQHWLGPLIYNLAK